MKRLAKVLGALVAGTLLLAYGMAAWGISNTRSSYFAYWSAIDRNMISAMTVWR